jgi:hypothetical protein
VLLAITPDKLALFAQPLEITPIPINLNFKILKNKRGWKKFLKKNKK